MESAFQELNQKLLRSENMEKVDIRLRKELTTLARLEGKDEQGLPKLTTRTVNRVVLGALGNEPQQPQEL